MFPEVLKEIEKSERMKFAQQNQYINSDVWAESVASDDLNLWCDIYFCYHNMKSKYRLNYFSKYIVTDKSNWTIEPHPIQFPQMGRSNHLPTPARTLQSL